MVTMAMTMVVTVMVTATMTIMFDDGDNDDDTRHGLNKMGSRSGWSPRKRWRSVSLCQCLGYHWRSLKSRLSAEGRTLKDHV